MDVAAFIDSTGAGPAVHRTRRACRFGGRGSDLSRWLRGLPGRENGLHQLRDEDVVLVDEDPEGYVRRTMVNAHIDWWRRRPWREEPTAALPEVSGPDASTARNPDSS